MRRALSSDEIRPAGSSEASCSRPTCLGYRRAQVVGRALNAPAPATAMLSAHTRHAQSVTALRPLSVRPRRPRVPVPAQSSTGGKEDVPWLQAIDKAFGARVCSLSAHRLPEHRDSHWEHYTPRLCRLHAQQVERAKPFHPTSPTLCPLPGQKAPPPARAAALAPPVKEPLGNGVLILLALNFSIFAADKLLHVAWMPNLYFWGQKASWWQFLTAAFCHANFHHLSSNMFLLWAFGKSVRPPYRHAACQVSDDHHRCYRAGGRGGGRSGTARLLRVLRHWCAPAPATAAPPRLPCVCSRGLTQAAARPRTSLRPR